jgi:hypothetical protein
LKQEESEGQKLEPDETGIKPTGRGRSVRRGAGPCGVGQVRAAWGRSVRRGAGPCGVGQVRAAWGSQGGSEKSEGHPQGIVVGHDGP